MVVANATQTATQNTTGQWVHRFKRSSRIFPMYDANIQTRFVQVEGAVSSINIQHVKLAEEQAKMAKNRKSVMELCHLMEHDLPTPWPTVGWDTAPDPTILKVNAAEIVPLDALKASLVPLLEGEAGFSSECYSISAGNAAGANTNFIIQFTKYIYFHYNYTIKS